MDYVLENNIQFDAPPLEHLRKLIAHEVSAAEAATIHDKPISGAPQDEK